MNRQESSKGFSKIQESKFQRRGVKTASEGSLVLEQKRHAAGEPEMCRSSSRRLTKRLFTQDQRRNPTRSMPPADVRVYESFQARIYSFGHCDCSELVFYTGTHCALRTPACHLFDQIASAKYKWSRVRVISKESQPTIRERA